MKGVNLQIAFAVLSAVLNQLQAAGKDKKYTVDEILDVVEVAVGASGFGDHVVYDGSTSE
jgi:hypothetical protein